MLALLVTAVLAGGDVEEMSLEDLLLEDTRLELRPSLVPPVAMLTLGLTAATAAYTTLGFALFDLGQLASMPRPRLIDGFGPDFVPSIIEAFAIIHGVFALGTTIGGMWWLSSRVAENEEAQLRQGRVRARITELERLGITPRRADIAKQELELVAAAYPNYSLPGQLLAGGLALVVVGASSFALQDGKVSTASAAISELVVGIAMTVVGAKVLHDRIRERERLDARRQELEAAVFATPE